MYRFKRLGLQKDAHKIALNKRFFAISVAQNYMSITKVVAGTLLCLPAYADTHYQVLIDAGSSGSRAHVFMYEDPLPPITLPIIKDIYTKSTNPGLSFYAKNPELAGQSLEPILEGSKTYLTNIGVDLSKVPVSVLATAGMRLLPLKEQTAIYNDVYNYIKNHHTFSVTQQNIRTISGIQEGVFGWLDINYLSNNLIHPEKTIGSIDMGGASTQIAFATADMNQPENILELTINQTKYKIFSQSFLNLGQNQALNTMVNHINSPSCFPSGYSYNEKTGNFDFSSCSLIYSEIIQNNTVLQSIAPITDQKFIAYSGIFYNYDFFNLIKTPNQTALNAEINATCYLSWDTLQTTYPNIPNYYLANFCANGVYFDSLLYNTYRLEDSQLTVAKEINGTEIDWTLGALLYTLLETPQTVDN